ncbi:hypothetical protein UPYG_G00015240 [Umbra pygmaea]|uniref:Interleukin-7 n=1 Tax=Umbra pygmaea TaxID=75934 RepID=A0ABD0XJJ0_UMBPY
MCVNGPVLRTVVVFLLLGVSCSCNYCRRRCNYNEILESYRELIFVELQNLNLTGTFDTSKERDCCPSGKAPDILRSIHGLAHQFLCQRHGTGRKQLEGMEKPVVMMQDLISENCNSTVQVRRQKTAASCATSQRCKKKRKKMRLIRALINCWQKLQSICSFEQNE